MDGKLFFQMDTILEAEASIEECLHICSNCWVHVQNSGKHVTLESCLQLILMKGAFSR